jgi:nucleoside-diphosphate-sugar epimerase
MISINNLAKLAMSIAGKNLLIKNIPGPTGVRGRKSDNTLIKEKLGWSPSEPLKIGMEKTYRWIEEQVRLNSIKK